MYIDVEVSSEEEDYVSVEGDMDRDSVGDEGQEDFDQDEIGDECDDDGSKDLFKINFCLILLTFLR